MPRVVTRSSVYGLSWPRRRFKKSSRYPNTRKRLKRLRGDPATLFTPARLVGPQYLACFPCSAAHRPAPGCEQALVAAGRVAGFCGRCEACFVCCVLAALWWVCVGVAPGFRFWLWVFLTLFLPLGVVKLR